MLLAIEVSQREGAVALARMDARADSAGSEVIEIPIGPPDPAVDRLMPAIDAAFRALKAEPGDLAAVIVSIGPGGFTGLRMAVATAKALALGVGCEIVAVPSAVVAASTLALELPETREAFVALACKGDDAWIAHVRVAQTGCELIRAELADAAVFERMVAEARESRDDPDAREPRSSLLICDEHLPASLTRVANAMDLSRAPLRLSARACLHEGRALLARHEVTTADALAPLYPREPEAVRLWRIRQAQQSRGGTSATA